MRGDTAGDHLESRHVPVKDLEAAAFYNDAIPPYDTGNKATERFHLFRRASYPVPVTSTVSSLFDKREMLITIR